MGILIQEECYRMSMFYPKEMIADTFGRSKTGGIDFDSLDNRVLMVELKGGVRYVGLVACGKNGDWVLHTAHQLESEGRADCVGGLSIDDYVFPLRETKYQVVKNQDKESNFKYFLRTNERSCFDLTRDSTFFEKIIPPALEGLFPGF